MCAVTLLDHAVYQSCMGCHAFLYSCCPPPPLNAKHGCVVCFIRLALAPGLTLAAPCLPGRLPACSELFPTNAAYNMPRVLDLDAKPDTATLQAALNLLAWRHEVMRMRYRLLPDGVCVGVVVPPQGFEVPLQVHPTSSPEEAAALLRQENGQPFNLMTGPLVRARLLAHTYTTGATLCVSMHHAVSDAWSQNLFMGELDAAYRAAALGTQPAWDPLPIQYADFAAWSREQLAGEVGRELLHWWAQALAGAPPLLQLPLDRPRVANPTYELGTVRGDLAPGLLERLQAVAAKLRVNLVAVTLAALQAVLLRYSGQDDIVVGIPVAGRDLPETQGLVGYFVQSLPVRCTIPEGTTLGDMACAASRATVATLAHSLLPFHAVVAASRQQRIPGANPVTQASKLAPAPLHVPLLHVPALA